ncbi:hypothetical protein RIF29_35898 [Crotalaria pallida]|uniref:TF-B3 domain-containing protein n=1 Tax=Crotalaria pallida TaxID=3830 RepID=A0AAN9EAX6_CROPI
MGKLRAPFPIPTTTTTPYVSHPQQNVDRPQNAQLVDDSNALHHLTTPSTQQMCLPPPPYFVPYDQNSMSPCMNQPPLGGYPMNSVIGEQRSVSIIPHYQPQCFPQSSREDKEMREAFMAKIARHKRKLARQRKGNYAPDEGPSLVPDETIRGQIYQKEEIDLVFYAPDGKVLKEIFTKKLRSSDVGSVGRIVIPKRESEEMLPSLSDKDGIYISVKDLHYADLQWTFRFKYWSNNKSYRMYVLENTGNFVNQHNLRVGDYMTLFQDEFKNLYVLAKKEEHPEEHDHSSSSSNMEGLQADGAPNSSYTELQAPDSSAQNSSYIEGLQATDGAQNSSYIEGLQADGAHNSNDIEGLQADGAQNSSYIEGLQADDGAQNCSYNMDTPSYANQATDEEEQASLALLLNEFGQYGEGEAAANNILTICNGGGSSA